MPWSRTSRHERGYGREWDRLRQQAMTRDKYLCQPCLGKGQVTAATEVDHVMSKAKGGKDEMGNVQAICSDCHREKTARESAEAQGRTYRPRVAIGTDGWPVE